MWLVRTGENDEERGQAGANHVGHGFNDHPNCVTWFHGINPHSLF